MLKALTELVTIQMEEEENKHAQSEGRIAALPGDRLLQKCSAGICGINRQMAYPRPTAGQSRMGAEEAGGSLDLSLWC